TTRSRKPRVRSLVGEKLVANLPIGDDAKTFDRDPGRHAVPERRLVLPHAERTWVDPVRGVVGDDDGNKAARASCGVFAIRARQLIRIDSGPVRVRLHVKKLAVLVQPIDDLWLLAPDDLDAAPGRDRLGKQQGPE